MDLTLSENPIRVVQLSGRFDAHEITGFRNAVEPYLAAADQDVRVDLTDVLFIDSTALAELVRATHRARAVGYDLLLVGLSTPVRVILELTRLDLALTIATPGSVLAR